MDIARWMIPGATLPKSVVSLGGRFGYKDQGETPNTQIAVFDYGDTQLIFEVRGLKTDDYHGEKVGNIVHLEEGTIAGDKFYPKGERPRPSRCRRSKARARGPGGGTTSATSSPPSAAGRPTTSTPTSSKATTPAALCHLANISYRLGEPVPFDAADQGLRRRQGRRTRPSTGWRSTSPSDNGLKLDGLSYRLGRKLDGRRQGRDVRRRPRGQQAPDPALPQAVRRPRVDRLRPSTDRSSASADSIDRRSESSAVRRAWCSPIGRTLGRFSP